LLDNHPPGIKRPDTEAEKDTKELFRILDYPEGEIPVFDKDKDPWTMVRFEPVATQKRDSPWWNIFGSGISWTDTYAILLDSQFVLLVKETSPAEGPTVPAVTKSTHVIRPIPLEYLQLASFDDEPEIRKYHIGLLKRIRLSPTKEPMYPFTIYHAAAKITRRYTLYTKKGTERNKWKVALEKAIEARKSQQAAGMLYEPQVLNDGFFKIAPRIQFTRGITYTGRVTCATLFSFQREDYIAIGCTSGIYVSKRVEGIDYSFKKVLEFNEPNSIVAMPEFNKFIVHCELALFSYPLDKVIRVSRAQGDAAFNLGAPEEGFAQGHGDVLFFKAGRIADLTVVIYATKISEEVKAHVEKLIHHDGSALVPATYFPLCSPMSIPEDPHDATCFHDKVAICTSKAIYFVEPTSKEKPPPPPKAVPRIAQEVHKKKSKVPFRKVKVKEDAPKVVQLVAKANVLGMVTHERDLLLVYNDLGCFVDQEGKPARSTYYIEWERKATAFARRGPHLLLFSPGYIEVRNIETVRLIRMVPFSELRPLRSGISEGLLLIAVMTGGTEDDGSRTERLVELKYRGVD
jgi:hypothetical protein